MNNGAEPALGISVIIPTFNRADHVASAIRSAFEQGVKPLEILVVDDGSTDSTAEVVSSFGEPVRYLRQENRGVSAARNLGIRSSRGPWIAFLDSDDQWHPDKLQQQLECIVATGASVCFTASRDEHGADLDDTSLWENRGPAGFSSYPAGDCRLFKHNRHPFVQSLLVSRDALLRAGCFDETLVVAEDTKLVYRLVLDEGCAVVHEGLTTITRQRKEEGLSDTADVVSAYRRFECYARVQAEVYWQLVPLDAEAALVVRRNFAYFSSRQAEIATAMGDRAAARQLAKGAIDVRAGWRNLARNAWILCAYPIAARRFAAKWGVADGVTASARNGRKG